jgi:hypothetical protein
MHLVIENEIPIVKCHGCVEGELVERELSEIHLKGGKYHCDYCDTELGNEGDIPMQWRLYIKTS